MSTNIEGPQGLRGESVDTDEFVVLRQVDANLYLCSRSRAIRDMPIAEASVYRRAVNGIRTSSNCGLRSTAFTQLRRLKPIGPGVRRSERASM
jgi:hypothetical protein